MKLLRKETFSAAENDDKIMMRNSPQLVDLDQLSSIRRDIFTDTCGMCGTCGTLLRKHREKTRSAYQKDEVFV